SQPLTRRVEGAQAFDSQPSISRIGRNVASVLEGTQLLGEPLHTSATLELFRESRFQRQQIAHIIERVFDLLGRQWPPRPVGARVRFRELYAEQSPHQFAIADLRRQPC